jgi:flagellar assembly protein FliH
LHSSSVLKGARIVPERRRVRAEELVWPGLGPDGRAGGRSDPLIYSERDVEQLLANVRRESFEEGRAGGHDEGRAAGHQAGYQEGVEVGHQEEHDQVRSDSELLAALVRSILQDRARIVISVGRDLVQLALTMAERVVRRSLPFEDEAVLRAIREALGHVGDTRRVIVRLNPRELDLVRAHERDLGALVAADAGIELRPDPAVTPGGCVVDTPELHLDATVEALLEQFEEVLSAWYDGVTREATVEPATAGEDASAPPDGAGEVEQGDAA